MLLILQREESVDTVVLCHELRERARRATASSAAVDRLEWRAARAIEALVYEVQQLKVSAV